MPTEFFQQYQIKAEPPPSAIATALIAKFESSWHQPWSEPVRFKIQPRLQVVLAASGLFWAANTQESYIRSYESRWHYPWSEPVRLKRGLQSRLQQTLAWPSRIILNPDVILRTQVTEINADIISLTISVYNEPPIPIDLTAINVSIVEVAGNEVGVSIKEDE